jgi:hypothetical protein
MPEGRAQQSFPAAPRRGPPHFPFIPSIIHFCVLVLCVLSSLLCMWLSLLQNIHFQQGGRKAEGIDFSVRPSIFFLHPTIFFPFLL